jgi:hypothetical protein
MMMSGGTFLLVICSSFAVDHLLLLLVKDY